MGMTEDLSTPAETAAIGSRLASLGSSCTLWISKRKKRKREEGQSALELEPCQAKLGNC